MSRDTETPSAAVLRQVCASIASDLGQAPLRTDNYNRLTALTKQFLTLESTMTATSDIVSGALTHANQLIREADKWKSISEEGGTLRNAFDHSMTRVAGPSEAATVSSDVAHP